MKFCRSVIFIEMKILYDFIWWLFIISLYLELLHTVRVNVEIKQRMKIAICLLTNNYYATL